MNKYNETNLNMRCKALIHSKIINNYQILMLCFLSLFGIANAKEIKDTPVFDISFENLKTGVIERYYESPGKVIGKGRVKIMNSPTEANSINAMAKVNENRALVYSNGMFTSYEDANDNLEIIEDRLASFIGTNNIKLAFNNNEGIALQAGEVATQHIMQESNLTLRESWNEFLYRKHRGTLLDNIEMFLTLFDSENKVNDLDLQAQIHDVYLPLLAANKKVVILAHSQGNFYANMAWKALSQRPDGYNLSKQIGVVAVATPANYVAGGGLHTTNSLDMVIGVVNQTLTPALPSNVTHPFTISALRGHGLDKIYLDPNPDGVHILNKIGQDINTTFNRLVIKDLSCDGFSRTGHGNTEITGYVPGENYSGMLNYSFDAFNVVNSLNVYSQYGSSLVGTGFVSGLRQGSFYYDSTNYKSLRIVIDKGYDPENKDGWELNITCPQFKKRNLLSDFK